MAIMILESVTRLIPPRPSKPCLIWTPIHLTYPLTANRGQRSTFSECLVNAESGAGVIQQFVWGIGGAGTETYAIDSIRVDKLEAESICKEDQVQDLDYGTTYSLGINDDNPIEGHVSQSFMPDEPYLQAVELKMRMGGSFPSSEYYATTINIGEGSPSGIVLGTATAIIPAG